MLTEEEYENFAEVFDDTDFEDEELLQDFLFDGKEDGLETDNFGDDDDFDDDDFDDESDDEFDDEE